MTIYDKLFVVWWLLNFMIVQALYQSERFKANKPSGKWWHFWQAVLFGCALTVVIPFGIYFGWGAGVKLGIIGILERLAIFGPLLNAIRGKKPILFYNGRGTTSSWQNNLENKLSDRWLKVLKIGYIILFVCAVIFIK